MVFCISNPVPTVSAPSHLDDHSLGQGRHGKREEPQKNCRYHSSSSLFPSHLGPQEFLQKGKGQKMSPWSRRLAQSRQKDSGQRERWTPGVLRQTVPPRIFIRRGIRIGQDPQFNSKTHFSRKCQPSALPYGHLPENLLSLPQRHRPFPGYPI